MRSNLCIGFLTLFALCVPSLLMSLDASALKHEYDGMSILSPVYPAPKLDQNTHEYYLDWEDSSYIDNVPLATGFSIQFEGDSWNDSLKNLRVRQPLHLLHTYDNNGTCSFKDVFTYGLGPFYHSGNIQYDWDSGINPEQPFLSNSGSSASSGSDFNGRTLYEGDTIVPPYWTSFPSDCWSLNGSSNHDITSYDHLFNNGLPSYPNGHEPLIYNVATVINNDNVFPYNFYSSGYPFESSHKSSDGVVYNKRFSFNTLFNQTINSFSHLRIGLDNYNGYWYDSSNLYNGRSIDFHFNFSFDSSLELSQSFINGGSLKLHATAVPRYDDNDPTYRYLEYNCTSTVRVVAPNDPDDKDYYWDITCPVTLEKDYIVWVPYLVIDGNDNKVFTTDGDWYFSSVYIVTDHDTTRGDSFNTDLFGNTNVWDTYWSDNDNNQFEDGTPDWLQSLIGMFTFGFFNPFAPIFQMFSDNNSCAQIPTIASLIHSEETEVCPWFDSTTRNIVTPVLGLASMMLIFGFAVRWLGSSSGNMFEDSSSETLVPPRNSGTWGRRKK